MVNLIFYLKPKANILKKVEQKVEQNRLFNFTNTLFLAINN